MSGDHKEQTGFTNQEREAMKARSRELAAEKRADRKRADGEQDALKVIEAMPEPDKSMARKIHDLVSQTAPGLWPKTMYGMPAYARDGKVVCFFQSAAKFGTRYATLGFNDTANLDEGTMWPTSFAITHMGPAEEHLIADLIKKAIN